MLQPAVLSTALCRATPAPCCLPHCPWARGAAKGPPAWPRCRGEPWKIHPQKSTVPFCRSRCHSSTARLHTACQICLPKPLPSLQSAGSAPAQPLGGCSSPVSAWHAAGAEHPAVAPAAAGTDTHRPPSTPDETLQGPVMTTLQLSPLLLSHRFLSTSSLPQIMTKVWGETRPVRAAGTHSVTWQSSSLRRAPRGTALTGTVLALPLQIHSCSSTAGKNK